MFIFNELLKKNGHKLKNVAQQRYDLGEDVTYMLDDGTYITKYQDGRREIFNFVKGGKKILKVYYEKKTLKNE